MKALVTGAAGFIGSHLVEGLVSQGWDVTGIDALVPYYSPESKLHNLSALAGSDRFRLLREDLRKTDVRRLLDESTVVFHLAGQPGVAPSWDAFESYVQHNLIATQHLLEDAAAAGVRKVVLASSSSVYGNSPILPLREDLTPSPISPYGVTKHAAEQVAAAYAARFSLPVVTLRYFTVYGPRQRPDMAIARFVDAIGTNQEVEVYGDGAQTRDLTFVNDVVHATIRAGQSNVRCATVNVAGGTQISVLGLVAEIADILGRAPRIAFRPARPGDVFHTAASVDRARDLLGFAPAVGIREGLQRQVGWWTASRFH
jgi:nucleoside-diphosphate-sugar epimerase